MASIEFAPRQHETENITAHVIWMTSGLSCDGESVALTSAVDPSIEDIITGAIPGMPKVVAYWPLFAFANGTEFMEYWYDAEAGRLQPLILVVEGSVPNESINGRGHWAAMGTSPYDGQPITTTEWIDRLAPQAAVVIAVGTCATYGGVHAMRNNPTGAMGVCDYLGWGWTSVAGLPVINVPGCPAQPDNMTETLTILVMALAGITPIPELDDQHRLVAHFGRTVHERCNRAGFYEHGDFATQYGSDDRCLVKLGCKGPVAKCNVPVRGWQSGVGGCPNVGGICIGCTMPGFPDKFMPFMDEDTEGKQSSTVAAFTYGPIVRHLRNRLVSSVYDNEPPWRRPGTILATGYAIAWTDAPMQLQHSAQDEDHGTVAFRASMPEVVALGATAQVEVELTWKTRDEPGGAQRGLEGRQAGGPDAPLVVQVLPRSGVAVRGHDQLTVPIALNGAPTEFLFIVEAVGVGPGEVWVLLSQGQVPLRRLVLRCELADTISITERTSAALTLGSGAATELTRFTIYEREIPGEGVVYDYGIDIPSLRIFRRFESPVIRGRRDAYVQGLYTEIEALTRQPGSVSDLEARLRGFGGELFDELLPRELRELLWTNRDRLSDVMVVSTEPFIPWEMLHIKPPDGPLPDEVRFLAQIGLVRWRWGTSPPAKLTVRRSRSRYIIPSHGRFDAIEMERRFLEDEIGATPIAPRWTPVRDALAEAESFDLLHFAGHAEAPDNDFAAARVLLDPSGDSWQGNPDPLDARVVRQWSNFGSDDHRPLVVLNACQSGRAGLKLSSLGGFAEAFLEAGAGAFVGALWLIGDGPALAFVAALYRGLRAGDTFSTAVAAARAKAREEGDPTWLAYVVYARPTATVEWLP